MLSRKNTIGLIGTLIFISVLFFSCAPEVSNIQRYAESLKSKEVSYPSYEEVVSVLGRPEVYKVHEKDITASWTRTYWGKSRIASDLKGEKLIITFDKESKKMLNWYYRTW